MKSKGPVVTAVIAALALAGVVGAFVSNSSPYVTLKQARTVGGDSLHLLGTLVDHESRLDTHTGHTFFRLKDENGAIAQVELVGAKPSAMDEADKIVAIGALRGDTFVAHDLLTKCPSKYDDKPKDPLATVRS